MKILNLRFRWIITSRTLKNQNNMYVCETKPNTLLCYASLSFKMSCHFSDSYRLLNAVKKPDEYIVSISTIYFKVPIIPYIEGWKICHFTALLQNTPCNDPDRIFENILSFRSVKPHLTN